MSKKKTTKKVTMNNNVLLTVAEEHPLWYDFNVWAKSNDISLEHPDDWSLWFMCYIAGAKASGLYIDKIMRKL